MLSWSGSLGFGFLQCQRNFLQDILMGEAKLGFVPAIEDARIMLSLTSTKQSMQVASFVEGNK